jgi:hypothetical protein
MMWWVLNRLYHTSGQIGYCYKAYLLSLPPIPLALSSISSLPFPFLRQVLNRLGSPGWPWTQDGPASVSWVLGLQTCATLPSSSSSKLFHLFFRMLLHYWPTLGSFNPSCLEIRDEKHKGGVGAEGLVSIRLRPGAKMLDCASASTSEKMTRHESGASGFWEEMPCRKPRPATAAAALLRLSGKECPCWASCCLQWVHRHQ